MNDSDAAPLVLGLADAAATLDLVGGKGASLARLATAGLPVPPGFQVTTAAYRHFVAQNGLQEAILAAAATVAADYPATLDAASQQIGALFAGGTMPADVAEAIRRAYADLGDPELPVAVRSSATAEDLPEMSFAGQQETYLNVRGDAAVLAAVQRCWASLWTARAIGYRAQHGIAPQDVSLAVVVQALVPADAAGILFTANPLTGARDQSMISAAWGLGEAIVSGQVTPDTLVVDKANGAIIEQTINDKAVMTVRAPEGTREEPVVAERRTQPVLSPMQAAQLAGLGARIETLYGRPMDIEWTLHQGRIAVVQARPITALPEPGADSWAATWQLPNPRGRYARSSVLELLPDPLSPLFATLGLPAWARAMEEITRGLGVAVFPGEPLAVINGYGYYNLSYTPAQSIKLALAVPYIILGPFPRLLRSARPRWQAARSRYAAVVIYWQKMEMARTPAARLLAGARAITDEAADYYLTIQSGILPGAYMSEALFTQTYNRLLKRPSDPPALTFMLGFDSAPIRAEASLYTLAQWVRGEPALAEALAGMTSKQFAAAYRDRATATDGLWLEFWRRLDEHLAHYGHTIFDLDFARPVLADDPTPILETLKFFLSGQAPDPYVRQATAARHRDQAMRTVLAQRGDPRAKLVRWLLDGAQGFAPLREDALADIGLGWPVLRHLLHEVGRRLVAGGALDAPDDIFWLTLADLEQATAALDTGQPVTDYHKPVAERRATWQRQRALTPLSTLPPKEGARFLGIDFSSLMPARVDQPAGDVLHGVGASPGRVTGTARVIHGPEEFDQLQRGDILVARITTPAWTPLFALASGVVTDVGGPLSHSSIVAREYHIPAVLGTGVATERLHSGLPITVDGDAGTVTSTTG